MAAGTFTTYLVFQTMLCILYIGLTAVFCEMGEVSQTILQGDNTILDDENLPLP